MNQSLKEKVAEAIAEYLEFTPRTVSPEAAQAAMNVIADWIEMEGVAYNGGCSIHDSLANELKGPKDA